MIHGGMLPKPPIFALSQRLHRTRNRKFESTSLQQTVRLSRDFSFLYRKAGGCRGVGGSGQAARPAETRRVVNITPIAGNVSVGPYSSTAVPARRFTTVVALVRPSEVGLAT